MSKESSHQPGAPEGTLSPDPVAVFDKAIVTRHQDLLHLSDSLKRGLEVVGDQARVNRLLADSSRPELVMTQRITCDPPDLDHIDALNNFIPRMRAFGMPVYTEGEKWDFGELLPQFVGRREFTDEEREQVFLMGARGGYLEQRAFAEGQEIDRDFSEDMYLQTHLGNEAFMRMWILMPELTEELMQSCLQRPQGENYLEIKEELFVTYAIMSSLIDVNDNGVIRRDGTVDDWVLCH